MPTAIGWRTTRRLFKMEVNAKMRVYFEMAKEKRIFFIFPSLQFHKTKKSPPWLKERKNSIIHTALGPIPFASVRANGMGAPAPHPSNHPFIAKTIISVIRYNYMIHHPNVEYPCRLFKLFR